MAVVYGTNLAGRNATPVAQADGAVVGGRVRVRREIINLASQAVVTTSDTIPVAFLDAGDTFLYGVITANATMGGSATLAIGITGATGKYRAAAVFTAVDTPTLFGVTAANTKLTAGESVFITVAAASLPAAGILIVDMYYAAT